MEKKRKKWKSIASIAEVEEGGNTIQQRLVTRVTQPKLEKLLRKSQRTYIVFASLHTTSP